MFCVAQDKSLVVFTRKCNDEMNAFIRTKSCHVNGSILMLRVLVIEHGCDHVRAPQILTPNLLLYLSFDNIFSLRLNLTQP